MPSEPHVDPPVPTPPVVDDVAELTAEWLTAALADRVGVPVREVRSQRVGNGQIGTNHRLHLTWADPEGAAAVGAPSTLVAKMAGGDPSSRTLVAEGYRNEVGFYTEIAHTLAVRTPRCWYAAISDDSTCFVLLLDDLAPAEPGDQIRGCSVAEAEHAVVNLAGLHGPRWCDADLLDIDWLRRQDAAGAAFHAEVLAGATPVFLERFGERLGPGDAQLLEEVPNQLADWLLSRPERFAVIHGDYRPDNLMFPTHGAGVAAVDWQTLGLGLPGRDVGYLLATSLHPDLRREAEKELVRAYHDALVEHGVTGHPYEECFEDYRLGVVQGPLITVLGAVYATAEPSERSDAMFTAMATRSCAALRDLDPFSLL